MQLLKLSQTAEPICFLIVQSSDHITGLTGASPTVTISKAGAAFGSPSGAVTEVGSGWYKIAGNSSDSGTLGPLLVHYTAASGDPGDVVCQVVAYDPESASVVASSVTGAVGSVTGAVGSVTGNVGGNVVGSVASVTAAVTLSASDSGILHSGTAQAGASTSITLAAGANATTSLYNGQTVRILGGTGAGQSRVITSYTGASKVATVNRAWATTPDATSTYSLLATDGPKTDTSLNAVAALASVDSLALVTGTAQAGGASTITLAAGASATDNLYVGEALKVYSGTGAGQVRTITGYVGSTKVATVDRAWATNPDSTSLFAVLATTGPALNSSLQDVAASVAGAVGSVTGAVGSVTGAVGSVTAAVTVGTNNDKTGYTASTVSDKTGYSLAADQAVNVTKVNGTTQTARDLGASVLISPGTGAGQLDVTSGVIKANLAQILGTALTETAGQIAAGVKKFFDIVSPTSTMNTITTVTTATNLTTNGDKTGYALTVTPPTSAQIAAALLVTPANLIATNASNQVVASSVQGNVTGSVGSVTGAVGSVTGNVGGSVVGSVASVSGAVGSVTGNVGGSVASVTADVGITQVGADKVWSTTVRKLSAEGVQAVWDALLTNLITVGSIGKRVVDFMTNKVYADPPAAPDNTDIIAIKARTDNLPADPASNTQVNTRMPSGNVTVGGYAAGTAPPLATDYTAARAGKLDNLDINVGSRGTGDATAANQATINTNVLSRLAAGSYTAPPSVGAIDTQLTGTHGAGIWQQGNTVAPDNAGIAAIKAQTDNLPTDPASDTQVNTRMATFTYTTPPSTASIVTAILDGLLTGHNIADSVAVALAAAGSAGSDPLLTPLPNDNTYPVGTAGYRIGHSLDAPVSTRAVSGSTTTTSPVTASGDVINIVRGDDYGPAPAGLPRVLQTFSAGVIPDATNGGLQYVAPLLVGSPFTGVLIVTGATGEQVFALDLTHTATLAMVAGNYPYAAELTVAGGERTTIRRGTIRVLNPA